MNTQKYTADDEMLSRAVLEARKHKGTALALHSEVQAILTAALTPPPPRSEWADIEDVINAGWPGGINGSDNGYIARTLYEGGVRATGAES